MLMVWTGAVKALLLGWLYRLHVLASNDKTSVICVDSHTESFLLSLVTHFQSGKSVSIKRGVTAEFIHTLNVSLGSQRCAV